MNVLTMRNVSHSFDVGPDRVIALDDVTLSVATGEFVAVMGPSGSGKSTLVNVAAGLVQPLSGQVLVGAIEVTTALPGTRAHLRRDLVGIMHQTDELDPVLNSLENVALPLLLGGTRKTDAEQAARDALAQCDAGLLAERTRDQLSGGQRQRVALARAIVGHRELVLADEPTAALDTVTARGLVETLSQLASAGSAVVMTTHDSRLATYADRVVLLRDGRQVDATAPASIELRDLEVQA
jgi:putative ABC transport system ATP-binding protein